jgi:hypothetical protein
MGEQILGATDVVSALVSRVLLAETKYMYRLAPGIMVMQFCTIFFPIFEAYSSQAQLRTSLHAIQPSKQKWSGGGNSNASNSYRGSTATTVASTTSKENEKNSTLTAGASISSASTPTNRRMYSMAALEKALAINPTPLLQFATSKDFTGENIVFLLRVRQWRLWWDQAVRDKNGFISDQAKRQIFRSAIVIYLTSVHMKTSVFPININSRNRSRLESMFGGAVWTLEHTENKTYGADIFASPVETREFFLPFLSKHLGDIGQPPCFTNSSKTLVTSHALEPGSQYSQQGKNSVQMKPGDPESEIPIPTEFGPSIFDDAEREVRDMVVTNTWPRFVDSVKLHEDMKIWSASV